MVHADINIEHENKKEDIKGTSKEGKIYLLIKVMCISHKSLTSTPFVRPVKITVFI
jgi:hypothetical protein